jgi:hypothetical protein
MNRIEKRMDVVVAVVVVVSDVDSVGYLTMKLMKMVNISAVVEY